jgi:hypothetical protein
LCWQLLAFAFGDVGVVRERVENGRLVTDLQAIGEKTQWASASGHTLSLGCLRLRAIY